MIPGFTSTGSKRPEVMFGNDPECPRTMVRAVGCSVWDSQGREYLDTSMALGAVSLGYAHPAVTRAAKKALEDGVVGPLAPALEDEVAERLASCVPGVESVRFFKTGAEAVAAAVRIARVATGRDRILTCGYQGWLDVFSDASGVPPEVRGLRREIGFNDVGQIESALTGGRGGGGDTVAAVVIEPVIDAAPAAEWVHALNDACRRSGALLVLDEIKTGLRLGLGGAAARYGFAADLTVLGKALGNGLPIAAVGGSLAVMDAATRTWISSTLATEFVGLAAAAAVLDVYERENVAGHLSAIGDRFFRGLERIAHEYPTVIESRRGIPEFCYLQCNHEDASLRLGAGCSSRGLIFKRNAYNFVSLAHTEDVIDDVLQRVGEVVDMLSRRGDS